MKRSGFSLIELIVVIAIIAIIAAAAFVAIDPARRINASRNTQRWGDVTAILEAVKKYQADNDGSWPASGTPIDDSTSDYQLIGEGIGSCATATCAVLPSGSIVASNCGVDGLDTDLRPYLGTIPYDSKTGSGGNTHYFINKDAYGILTVGACDAEGEGGGGAGNKPDIQVTR